MPGIQSLVRDLNRAYRDEPALWELDSDPSGFWWLEPNDADNNILAFARRSADGDRVVVFIANLSPTVQYGYRLGLPRSTAGERRSTPIPRYYGGSRRGQPRWRHARAHPVERPALLGRADVAAAGGAVARPG